MLVCQISLLGDRSANTNETMASMVAIASLTLESTMVALAPVVAPPSVQRGTKYMVGGEESGRGLGLGYHGCLCQGKSSIKRSK